MNDRCMMRSLFLAIAVLLAGSTAALDVAVDSPVVPGMWNDGFSACRAYAEREAVPMVMVWSQEGCSHCSELKAQLSMDDSVAWQSGRPYVFCIVEGARFHDIGKYEGSGAVEFAERALGARELDTTPYVCLYRPYGDGTYSITNFTGASGLMLVDRMEPDGRTRKTVRKQFMESVDGFFAQCGKGKPAEFLVSDTPFDRLEAEPGTGWVDIPLCRKGVTADGAATNTLVAVYPNGVATTNAFCWAPGEAERTLSLEIHPGGAVFEPGGVISLTLWSEDLTGMRRSSVHLVGARRNEVSNPYFPGERASTELDYADWTLDYDAVKDKVAAVRAAGGRAYTLAVYSGVLWCPYCKGIEQWLFDDPEFSRFLEDEHVQIALFDQALSPTDANPWGAELLSYTAGEEHVNGAGQRDRMSGAGYLSRHGLRASSPEVMAVRERSITNSWTRWKAPESTALRISTPTLLLIGPDDSVQGRFVAWRDRTGALSNGLASAKSPEQHYAKYYDPVENIGRLRDFLRLADRADESADYRTTTRRVHAVGDVSTVALQVNDATEWLRLSGLRAGRVSFSVTNAVPHDVTLAYWRDGQVVDSGKGALVLDLDEVDLHATNVYLRVTAFPDASTVRYFHGAEAVKTTCFSAEVASSFTPRPGTISFEGGEPMVLESVGCVTVAVVRVGGTTGHQRARVSIGPQTTAVEGERFIWTDVDLDWADGEHGTRYVGIPVLETPGVFEGEQLISLHLAVSADSTAVVERDTFNLGVIDTADPCFSSKFLELQATGGFGTVQELPLYNVSEGTKVVLTLVSGGLPKGVSLVYDPASRSVRLQGTAQTPGVYSAVFTVGEVRPGGVVTGWETELSVEVRDPRTLNPFFKKVLNATLDLPSSEDAGVVVGQLALRTTSTGRISAKWTNESGQTRSFSGAWSELDDDGMLSARISRSGWVLDVQLSAQGRLSVRLQEAGAADASYRAWTDVSLPLNAQAFAGCYHVTLPVVAAAPLVESSGTGYLVLTFTSASALRNASISYSGRLPNGTSLSGTARLAPDPENPARYARTTVFRKAGNDFLSATFRIRCGGYDLHADVEQLRVVLKAAGSRALWTHAERAFAHETELGVYGGWYQRNTPVLDWLNLFGLGTSLTLRFDDGAFAESEKFGALGDLPRARLQAHGARLQVVETSGKLTFGYSRATGVFSGKASLQFVDGRTVRGSYFGLLLPGWVDCGCGIGSDPGDGIDPDDPTRYIERPFGSGTFFYRDTLGGKSVARGLPVDLISE